MLKHRASLLGLNAPTKLAVLTDEMVTAEVEVRAQEMNIDLEGLRQLARAQLQEPEQGEKL